MRHVFVRKRILLLFIIIIISSISSSSLSSNKYIFKLIGTKTASAGVLSTDVQIAFEVLFNDVLVKTGDKIELTILEDFDKVKKLFSKDKEYSGIYCSSVEFVNSHLVKYIDEKSLITAVYNKHGSRKILIVAKKDSSIKTLDDLHNKDITYGQSSDLIELYLNTIAIERKNMLANTYFKTINNKQNGSESLISLYFGNTDIAAVFDDEYDLAIELNPQLKNELVVIEESPHLLNAVVGVRSDVVGENTKQKFIKIALDMHKHKKGITMLSMHGAKRFKIIDIEQLYNVKELVSVYKEYLEKN